MAKALDAKVLLVNQSDRIKAQGSLTLLDEKKNQQSKRSTASYLFASVIILLGLTSCTSGNKTEELTLSESDGSCAQNNQPHPRYFKFLANYCPDKKPGEPMLLAYIPDQSIDTDVFSKLFSGTLSSVICAPGPVLLSDKSQSAETKPWHLDAMPTLLLWYQEGSSEANESFYIMDPSGFPLKAKTITLAEKNEFVIALAPQASMSQTPHYIYLKKEKTGEPQSLWIQSIKL